MQFKIMQQHEEAGAFKRDLTADQGSVTPTLSSSREEQGKMHIAEKLLVGVLAQEWYVLGRVLRDAYPARNP